MTSLRVKSAIDWWIKILIWLIFAILIGSTLFASSDEVTTVVFVNLLLFAFLAWIYWGTYYELKEDYLYCASGPFFERIPYDRIKSIRLTENLFSSFALSTKRLEIRQHGKGFITGTTYISPINRQEFYQELIKRCKNLEIKE